jgi:hypothetical protein
MVMSTKRKPGSGDPRKRQAPVFWHGGVPGLAPGDWILPRSETGIFKPYDVLGPLAAAGMGGWFARAGARMDGSTRRVYVCERAALRA